MNPIKGTVKMMLYKFGRRYIPEHAITGINIVPAGKDFDSNEVFEIRISTQSGDEYITKMPLSTAELLIKTTFSHGNITNVSDKSSDEDYIEAMRETGRL